MTELAFPGGARVAVAISVFFESWEGTPLPYPVPPLGFEGRYLLAESWAAYGHKVGLARILDALAATGLMATFGVSGLSADQHPALVRRIAAAGHEIVAHSYAQDTRVVTLDEDQERSNIRRSVEAIERATGHRPTGWISPGFQATASTPRLLVEAGFTWHGDYMDQDLPYLIDGDGATLVAVPYVNDVNDIRTVVRNAQLPMTYFDQLETMVGYHTSRPNDPPVVLALTAHAHVFGRAEYVPALDRSLRYLAAQAGIWVARRGELAQWALATGRRGA